MPVTMCQLANAQPGHSVDDRYLWTYKVRYDITTDQLMHPAAVGLSAQLCVGKINTSHGEPGTLSDPLPKMWDAYMFKGLVVTPKSYARSYSFQQNPANQKLWTCEVTFTPLQPGEHEDDKVVDPSHRPAKFSVDREVYSKILEKDIDGKQIVNTAGRMYDEPLEQESTRGVLVIQKNVPDLFHVMDYVGKFSDAVNKKSWGPQAAPGLVVKPRQALCRDVSAGELQTEGDFQFYTVTFRISLKQGDETWDRSVLERGYRYYPSDVIKLAEGADDTPPPEDDEPPELNAEQKAAAKAMLDAVQDDSGAEPVLLDADGGRLAAGADAIFTDWRTQREEDFSGIPTI